VNRACGAEAKRGSSVTELNATIITEIKRTGIPRKIASRFGSRSLSAPYSPPYPIAITTPTRKRLWKIVIFSASIHTS